MCEPDIGVCKMCVVCVCVCVCVCVSDVCSCEMCVCVCGLFWFGFRFAGMSVVVSLSWFVGVSWFFVESCSVLFRFVLAFELTGCCTFFVLGCFAACPFVSALSWCCVRSGWFVMDAVLFFKSNFLARERSSSSLAPCVVAFHVYASADARWCARRLAFWTLVPFCLFKVVVIFCGSCFGALCVVVCWMFEGCSWLVGGVPRCRVLCWLICSGVGFC